jgi:hypothetical protein
MDFGQTKLNSKEISIESIQENKLEIMKEWALPANHNGLWIAALKNTI